MRKLLLVCFLPVLLFCSACGISQSDYDAAVSAAYEDGQEDGYDEGYSAGYDDGEADGYEDGYQVGNNTGYNRGVSKYFSELKFFRNNAAIVSISGNKYHHYGCGHISGRRYYIYNIELAQARGYTPCLDCWESRLLSELLIIP